jgi:hypothetical protein
MHPNLLNNHNSQIKIQIEEWLAKKADKKKIPTIPVETNLSAKDFQKNYIEKNMPVILRGMIEKWPARKKWDFDYFAKTYSNLHVNINLYDKSRVKDSTMKGLVEQIKIGDPKDPAYLQEWWFQHECPELLKDMIVPPHFAHDQNLKLLGYRNSTLWIGQKGAFTPVHQDTVFANIWTAQIRGRKEWFIFDKDAVIHPNKSGKPDFDKFLKEKKNHAMIGVLEAGDILYVPFKWWHRANTLENAISVNTFHISDEIAQRYIKDVMAIPIAMCLNRDILIKHDPMRYNITISRIKILAKLMGMNAENILGIELGNKEAGKGKIIND